ncbi:MAG: T9SS type A sorting domain-containing protein [Saprospiraceae bacterium]
MTCSKNGVAGTTIILGNLPPHTATAQHRSCMACPIIPLVSNPNNDFATGEMFAEKPQHVRSASSRNSAKGQVNIEFDGYEGVVELMVTDQLGRTVVAAGGRYPPSTARLVERRFPQNGIYHVTVISDGERMTKCLVVAK